MQKLEQYEEIELTKEEFANLDLNKNGRPKQQVILFELTQEIKNEASQQISKDTKLLPQQDYQRIIKESAKIWDKFYKNHKCNFFKDRKYLQKEIPELGMFREKFEKTKQMSVFVELGCGVGNTFFPIHNQFQCFRLYGCDFAASAIKLINKQVDDNVPKYDRIKVTTCDLVKQQIPHFFEKGDLVTLIFVLSAIDPLEHYNVINKIYQWMKPDSYFYFRDYGRYDFGQLNMTRKGNRKLKDNFYAKNDGVCVYYFEQQEIVQLCEKVGFKTIHMVSHCKLLQNRKTGLKMYRIWLQGRFYKPKQPVILQNKQQQLQTNEQKKQIKKEQIKQQQKTEQKTITKQQQLQASQTKTQTIDQKKE